MNVDVKIVKKTKLLPLGDEMRFLCGHGPGSSFGEERRSNPRLQVKSIDEYVSLMNNLNLPNPKLMDIAVPANLACGNS